MRPNHSTVRSTIALTSASFATSVRMKRIPSRFSSAWPSSWRRAATTTLAPSSTKTSAIFSPMPLVPPIEWFHGIGRLVNNAGVPAPMVSITAIDVASIDQLLAINVRGVLLGIKHVALVMLAQGGGSIINIGTRDLVRFRAFEPGRLGKDAGHDRARHHCLVRRFQSSNHMGCPKRPHSVDGRPKMQLSGFMESVV
jgi:NAD(P)-dependent dehydrogenase (short-subunit alcohol dehydrogenase family)